MVHVHHKRLQNHLYWIWSTVRLSSIKGNLRPLLASLGGKLFSKKCNSLWSSLRTQAYIQVAKGFLHWLTLIFGAHDVSGSGRKKKKTLKKEEGKSHLFPVCRRSKGEIWRLSQKYFIGRLKQCWFFFCWNDAVFEKKEDHDIPT